MSNWASFSMRLSSARDTLYSDVYLSDYTL